MEVPAGDFNVVKIFDEFVRDVVCKVTFKGRTGEGGEGAWVAFHGQDRQDLA